MQWQMTHLHDIISNGFYNGFSFWSTNLGSSLNRNLPGRLHGRSKSIVDITAHPGHVPENDKQKNDTIWFKWHTLSKWHALWCYGLLSPCAWYSQTWLDDLPGKVSQLELEFPEQCTGQSWNHPQWDPQWDELPVAQQMLEQWDWSKPLWFHLVHWSVNIVEHSIKRHLFYANFLLCCITMLFLVLTAFKNRTYWVLGFRPFRVMWVLKVSMVVIWTSSVWLAASSLARPYVSLYFSWSSGLLMAGAVQAKPKTLAPILAISIPWGADGFPGNDKDVFPVWISGFFMTSKPTFDFLTIPGRPADIQTDNWGWQGSTSFVPCDRKKLVLFVVFQPSNDHSSTCDVDMLKKCHYY